MTNAQERAKAVYEQLGNSTEIFCGQGVDVLKMQDDDIAVIATALSQVEVETWNDRRGELWSFIRNCMSQGGDILTDYNEGKYQGYEGYSSRLDAAARERVEEWLRQQAQRAKEGKG